MALGHDSATVFAGQLQHRAPSIRSFRFGPPVPAIPNTLLLVTGDTLQLVSGDTLLLEN